MQTGTLTLVLVLCLMGGVIAYGADLLGRHLGKKRLSLGRMRPKHTAAALTTTSGVLIPLITIGVLLAISGDVRDMLLRTAEIRRELLASREQLKQTQSQVIIRASEVADLIVQRERLTEQRDDLTVARDNATKALAGTRSTLRVTQSQLRSQQVVGRRLIAQARDLSRAVGRLRGDVQGQARALSQLRSEADRVRADSNYARDELQGLLRRNQDQVQELIKSERQLAENRKRIEDLEGQIRAAADNFGVLEEEFQRTIRQAEQELAQIRADQNRTVEEIARLRAAQSSLLEDLGDARTKPMIAARGEELTRLTVDPGLSLDEAQTEYARLLTQARRDAERRGARPRGDFSSVSLRPFERGGQIVSVRDQEQALLRRITGQGDPYVLILRAVLNTFEGESVPVTIAAEPDYVVFRPNEVVAETRIDGSLPEQQIFDALQTFIQERVSTEALRRNMIPAEGTEAPLGEVAQEDVLQIINDIREVGRTVRVQALAARSTRRSDRLQITFRLR